jgi:phosphoesterase RecJ-like protein
MIKIMVTFASMDKESLQQLKDYLAKPRNIVLIPHRSPDGDAIGSITALYAYLKESGHSATMISPNDFPNFLSWMSHTDEILDYEKQKKKADGIIKDAELIFILDHNALHRAGDMEKVLSESNAMFAMIDHHQQPDDFAQFTYSDSTMSSTCEMVYHFLDALGQTGKITPAIASSLYAGILTDTGSFKFRSTTSTTMRVAANLIDAGADSEAINRKIYDVNSPSRMKLLGTALNNMVIVPEYRTAYITLSQADLDEHDFQKGDTEGFVNYALSLDKIILAQIFIEKAEAGIVKTSLRSKGSFDVNVMARKHWDGGGHKNAAGGKSDLSMQATVEKLMKILPEYAQELAETQI